MWIDKILYWKDDGNNTVYPPPTEKRIEYASIKYEGLPIMQHAVNVWNNDVKTEVYRTELEWHRAHGAEITMPNE